MDAVSVAVKIVKLVNPDIFAILVGKRHTPECKKHLDCGNRAATASDEEYHRRQNSKNLRKYNNDNAKTYQHKPDDKNEGRKPPTRPRQRV